MLREKHDHRSPLNPRCSRCWCEEQIRSSGENLNNLLYAATVWVFPFLLLSLLIQLTSPPSGQSAPQFILCPEGMMHLTPKGLKNMQFASLFNGIRLYAFILKTPKDVSNAAGPACVSQQNCCTYCCIFIMTFMLFCFVFSHYNGQQWNLAFYLFLKLWHGKSPLPLL